MNEQQSISKTITQWTPLAKTGEDKPFLPGILHSCYLCQYSWDVSEIKKWPERCKVCPYYKNFGHCNDSGSTFMQWHFSKKRADRRIHAAAFLAQVKTLLTPEQHADALIDTLEKQLAEAKDIKATLIEIQLEKPEPEKPKPLEHGDYGKDLDGFIYLKDEIRRKNAIHWLGEYGNAGDSTREKESFEGKVIGNLVKDLAALSEPLKEFEKKTDGNGTLRVRITGGDRIEFCIGGLRYATAILSEAEEISLKLRRVIHKVKQDAAKQKAK